VSDGRGRADCLLELAQHEAGHALACFLLCGERVIKRIELACDPNGSARGSTTTYSRLPLPSDLRGDGARHRPISVEAILDAHGIIGYAGAASEGLRTPEPGRNGEPAARRAREDREALARMARSLGASRPADRLYAEYEQEATRLVTLHWLPVCELAELLVERRSLAGHRVDALLRTRTRFEAGVAWTGWAVGGGRVGGCLS